MSSPVGISPEFAASFGDALVKFLHERGMSQKDAANRLGLGEKRLSTYCHTSATRRRSRPDGEVLYLLCVALGFEFDYKGYRISAVTLNGNGLRPVEKP